MSLDEQLNPIIAKLEELYPVGGCSVHQDTRCVVYDKRPGEAWHFELDRSRLKVWGNAIVCRDVQIP